MHDVGHCSLTHTVIHRRRKAFDFGMADTNHFYYEKYSYALQFSKNVRRNFGNGLWSLNGHDMTPLSFSCTCIYPSAINRTIDYF